MKIAFFTEMGFTGKISRKHDNMRTEFAWMCALDADHYNINQNKSTKPNNPNQNKSTKPSTTTENK